MSDSSPPAGRVIPISQERSRLGEAVEALGGRGARTLDLGSPAPPLFHRVTPVSTFSGGPPGDRRGMAHEQKVCERCGRRFAAPAVIETRRCPLCDGKLVPLDNGPYPDPPTRPKGPAR